MQGGNFNSMVIATFKELQFKYNLSIIESESSINYSNSRISFSVYFEKNFEIYVCFHFHGSDFRMIDMLRWLCFDNCDVDLVKRNQIANKDNVKYVLQNLSVTLEKLLNILQNNPDILAQCLRHQMADKLEQQLAVTLSVLQQAWKAKMFKEFLALVDENRTAIMQTSKAEMIFKQELYIRNLMGQGDGSVVPTDES